ncbi:MAG: ABC transporter permease [Candidatus Limivivens sp.]|nr:ABC transporter permease [Candidatus Limivivens sp.]
MDALKRGKKTLLLIFRTIAVPLITYVFFEILDRSVAGVEVISTISDVKALLRTLLTSFCFAVALDCNLSLGRMDLSLGAQMYMGCILGGNLALHFNTGGIGVLILSILVGGITGFITGILFIYLRILPMILGIGLMLIYECISFSVNRQQGLMLFGMPGVSVLSDIYFILIVALILIFVMTFFFQYSTFGYERRAIQGNQKLSAEGGINIFKNCVICYTIAGALAACAGVFETAYSGTMVPVLGMASNTIVFRNMFPMMLGIWIGVFCYNSVVGIMMASLAIKILTQGLAKLSLEGNVQNIIIYTLFLLFVIYQTNAYRFDYNKKKRERIRLAKRMQEGMEKDHEAVVY